MYKKFKLLEDKKQEKLPIAMVVTRSKRHEETGRVLVNDHCQDNVCVIESFVEKPIINLENPEAVGIYLFTQRILDELMYCAEMHSSQSFDLSSDILSHVKYDEQNKLYAYDIEYTKKEWVDIESPTFVNRNKVSMKTIVNQMINWRIFD
jgi:mannose-1-phosphate guanylyltransferase